MPFASDPARASRLARAFDYPYPVPAYPICFDHGQTRVLPPVKARSERARSDGQWVLVDGKGASPRRYLPLLAIGSNASPAALRRKFGARPVLILQGPVRLSGFKVVHSAHVARYGAIPATLVPEAGAALHCVLQLIPDFLLPMLDASEAIGVNYDRAWMPLSTSNNPLHAPWLGLSLSGFAVYLSRHGAMLDAQGRVMALGPQKRALAYASQHVGWDGTLEDFALDLGRYATLRNRVRNALRNSAFKPEIVGV